MSREKVHFQSNKSSNWGKVVSQRSEQTKLKAVSRHKFLTAQLYLGHANFSSYSPLVECRGFIPAEVVKDVGLRNKFKAPLGAVGRALLRLNFIPNFSKRAEKKEGHRFPFFLLYLLPRDWFCFISNSSFNSKFVVTNSAHWSPAIS